MLESCTKTICHTSFVMFCFISLTKFATQNIRCVIGNTAYRKEFFPSKSSDTKLLQSIYFAYKVGIISSYLNRIWSRKIDKAAQRMLGSCNAALRTVFENHHAYQLRCTALVIIKPGNIKGLQIHCCCLVSWLITIVFSVSLRAHIGIFGKTISI